MTDAPTVKLTIAFTDPDPEEQEAEAQKLLNQLTDLEEVTTERVLDPNPPPGNKAAGSFLIGLLMAEVSMANFKKLAVFLGDRLGNKPIKLRVKAPDGRELDVEASSQAELDYAIQKAQAFLTATA
jgi:hypothetical protein